MPTPRRGGKGAPEGIARGRGPGMLRVVNAEGARGFRWTNVVLLLSALASPAAVAPWCATWHWSLDLLASFVVQATLWLGAATMALLAARRWRPATIVGATAAVG